MSGKELYSSSGVTLVASTHFSTSSVKLLSLRFVDEIEAFFLPIYVVNITPRFSALSEPSSFLFLKLIFSEIEFFTNTLTSVDPKILDFEIQKSAILYK